MIAWVAPPLESKSGLAVYARDLLPFLREKEEVRWLVPGDAIPPGADRIIYNLGNHPLNAPALLEAWGHPDTVLLHDANLHHAVLESGAGAQFFEDGEILQRIRDRGAWVDAYEVYSPGLTPLLNRQRLVLVHSAYAKDALEMRGVKTPVAVIPMGVAVPRIGADKEPCTLGIFGHIGGNRQIEGIAALIGSLKGAFPLIGLKVVGKRIPDRLRTIEGIRICEDVTDEIYFEELARTTLFLNLRYPVMGETSLTTLQAMALGTVPVVYDLGSYAELPGDSVARVGIEAELPDVLIPLLKDVKRRNAIERAGWMYVKENHSPALWAEKMWNALCGLHN